MLFLGNQKKEIQPNAFFLFRDTLFINEKWTMINGKQDFFMDEYEYRIQTVNDFKPLIKYYKH